MYFVLIYLISSSGLNEKWIFTQVCVILSLYVSTLSFLLLICYFATCILFPISSYRCDLKTSIFFGD